MENITRHGEKRLRKRLGATKANAHQRAEDAYFHGTPAKEFVGQFRGYLDSMGMKHKMTPIVYKGNIFIFGANHVLITCWPVDARFRKYLKKEKNEPFSPKR